MPVPVLLATDALFFMLFALLVAFAVLARRREHLRAPWRIVAHSRIAVTAAAVLASYAIVGLLDSVHFHPRLEQPAQDGATHSTEVLSLFDALVGGLRTQKEKTYSAPLAAYLYTMESVEGSEGTLRVHPRLRYGGAHLADPASDWGGDVALRVVQGAALAGLIWSTILAGTAWWHSRRSGLPARRSTIGLLAGQGTYPTHVLFLTLAVVLLLVCVTARLAAGYHVLGTDKVGQDVLYQALKSIRTGLVIGTLTTLVMLPAAVLLGVTAGYFRGWADDLIQYLYTTLSSIPAVLLIAAAILMMQVYISNHEEAFASVTERADLRLLFLCMILGVTSWTSLCRLLRGEVLKLRELDYVQAAQAFGVRHFTVLGRHVLPNVVHLVLITVVLDFSGLVLAEAVLSYVNIGVDPTTESWGSMVNGARLELAREPVVWWSLSAALGFMFALVLAANLLADVVRDALDPRTRATR